MHSSIPDSCEQLRLGVKAYLALMQTSWEELA